MFFALLLSELEMPEKLICCIFRVCFELEVAWDSSNSVGDST